MPKKPATRPSTAPPLRETRYARELASARLPSGESGKAAAAMERRFLKQTRQEEIRFSRWEGSRMMPRPLALPEAELLPLLKAAIDAGVFSDAFVKELRALLGGPARDAAPKEARALTDMERVQAHFHELIRSRAGTVLRDDDGPLPTLTAGGETEEHPGSFSVPGMDGGFKYWWDTSTSKLRLMIESWSRTVVGSGQLHEITPAGARLLGEGFV